MGSSPRRRGALFLSCLTSFPIGIIPAQAGSTSWLNNVGFPDKDHPRAGGEHAGRGAHFVSLWGSSPRRRGAHLTRELRRKPTWIIPAQAGSTPLIRRFIDDHRGSSPRRRGAPTVPVDQALSVGIIPAQAGSTSRTRTAASVSSDHPRAGGEHIALTAGPWTMRGSSPRRRGAQHRNRLSNHRPRIIPAQAGSTPRWRGRSSALPDHPRAGGEHRWSTVCWSSVRGSSPRRRGAQGINLRLSASRGIIPAQAGSTLARCRARSRSRDHPRAGGEHMPPAADRASVAGSSPRRRGALHPDVGVEALHRIIPAQAGSTGTLRCGSPTVADHPRAGGEHRMTAYSRMRVIGSSPRRRGARPTVGVHRSHSRIIPAQAGSTPSARPTPRRGGGSSPRRRGALGEGLGGGSVDRIIPAQAGSTPTHRRPRSRVRDHPRAGGEHSS